MDERKRRISLVGPVILIGLGIVLLLNNLGILGWSIWEMIFRLWPVLLIAAGLEILIGRSSVLGSLLALVLILALVAGALWLFWAGIGIGQEASATEEIRQALDGATRAQIDIAPAVGTLHVEALSEPANLVAGVIQLGSGERLRRDFAVEDETATFTVRSEGVTFGPFVGSWDDQRTWDLGLNPDVPLELEISLSVGQSNINLTGLTMSDVEVDMGVGKTTVVLPDEGRFRAEIEGAIGETVVVIPESMAARIRIDTGLAVRQLPASYQHRGHVYTSPDYESAENRVDLKVNQAIGNVTIRHSEGR